MNNEAVEQYHRMIGESESEIKKYDRLINIYSFLRLFALGAGGFLMWQAVKLEMIWLTELAFFALVIAFAWLVSRQSAFTKKKDFYSALKQVCENEIRSLGREENLYANGAKWTDDQHSYTSDLDIFGSASLFELINRCATPGGNEELASWLKAPAASPLVRERQDAVRELAENYEWVKKFQAVLLFANREANNEDVPRLLRYLQLIPEPKKGWQYGFLNLSPWLFFGSAALAWFFPFMLIALLLVGLVNIAIVLSHQSEVNKTERLLGKAGSTLGEYSAAFRMLEETQWRSPLCKGLMDTLKSREGISFSRELKQLSGMLSKLEYRLNMFVGPLLNISMAWDVRQLIAIEKWSVQNRHHVKEAFDVVANFEALISLSSLRANYSDWAFPVLNDEEHYTLQAESIGHPLIDSKVRVTNDFSLLNSRKIDIITGSNMAGKSTFLRTLGINCVLALSGAPVCAREMQLSNMKIFTYMRIKDSLNESISTFKAELNRLQLLLNVLQQGEKVYFLIDEMLRGTNSADKYLGSKAVIEKLISQGSVGIVATHDLQIARLEDAYPDYVRNYYFDIRVVDNEMLFDYKLKAGECRTFNASLLLKQLGIEF